MFTDYKEKCQCQFIPFEHRICDFELLPALLEQYAIVLMEAASEARDLAQRVNNETLSSDEENPIYKELDRLREVYTNLMYAWRQCFTLKPQKAF